MLDQILLMMNFSNSRTVSILIPRKRPKVPPKFARKQKERIFIYTFFCVACIFYSDIPSDSIFHSVCFSLINASCLRLLKTFAAHLYGFPWFFLSSICIMRPFFHSYIRRFVHFSFFRSVYLFIHSFIHTFIRSFIRLVVRSFFRSFVLSFVLSFVHSFVHSFAQSFAHSFVHSFIHSFSHSFVLSFVHSFLCSLTLWDK